MHPPTTLLSLTLAFLLPSLTLARLKYQVEFTQPPPGTRLNLSSPITVAWTIDPSSPVLAYDTMDIVFRLGDRVALRLFTNVTVAAGPGVGGTFDWLEMMNHTATVLSDGDRRAHFNCDVHGKGGEEYGPLVLGDEYEILRPGDERLQEGAGGWGVVRAGMGLLVGALGIGAVGVWMI